MKDRTGKDELNRLKKLERVTQHHEKVGHEN